MEASVWEGASLSNAGDDTKWINTYLLFSQDTGGVEGRYIVQGRGLSLWKDLRIVFLIHGELQLASISEKGKFRFIKQHTGRYTNKIEYQGLVDNISLNEDMILKGGYRSGNIILKRKGGRKEVLCSLLSGPWYGQTTSRSDVTIWSELATRFIPQVEEMKGGPADDHGGVQKNEMISFSGSGFSQWRNKSIPFNLNGTFNLLNKEIKLIKIHTGTYTNQVVFKGSLVLNETECYISADFELGTLKLSPTSLSNDSTSEMTILNLLHWTCGTEPSGTLSMSNPSLQRTSVSLPPLTPPRVSLMSPISDGRASSLHCILKGLRLLNGGWVGDSVDDAGTHTAWIETFLNFSQETSTETSSKICLKGHGVSNWKSKTIPFSLQGSCNLSDGLVDLQKQHTGAFTNIVKYSAHIVVLTEAEDLEFIDLWKKATCVIDKEDEDAVMRKKIDVYKLHQMENRLRFKLWRMGEEAVAGKDGIIPTIQDISTHACVKLVGSYGRGLLCLSRKWTSQAESMSAEEVSGNSPQDSFNRSNSIKSYQSFISGVMVASGVSGRLGHHITHHSGSEFTEESKVKLSSNQRRALQEYRDREGITDDEHVKALSDLGLTRDDVDVSSNQHRHELTSSKDDGNNVSSMTGGRTTSSQEQSNMKSVCVVCMEQPPTLACVPCGHVCMCEDDAEAFSRQADRRCPICRNHVQAIMKVYL